MLLCWKQSHSVASVQRSSDNPFEKLTVWHRTRLTSQTIFFWLWNVSVNYWGTIRVHPLFLLTFQKVKVYQNMQYWKPALLWCHKGHWYRSWAEAISPLANTWKAQQSIIFSRKLKIKLFFFFAAGCKQRANYTVRDLLDDSWCQAALLELGMKQRSKSHLNRDREIPAGWEHVGCGTSCLWCAALWRQRRVTPLNLSSRCSGRTYCHGLDRQ